METSPSFLPLIFAIHQSMPFFLCWGSWFQIQWTGILLKEIKKLYFWKKELVMTCIYLYSFIGNWWNATFSMICWFSKILTTVSRPSDGIGHHMEPLAHPSDLQKADVHSEAEQDKTDTHWTQHNICFMIVVSFWSKDSDSAFSSFSSELSSNERSTSAASSLWALASAIKAYCQAKPNDSQNNSTKQ